MAELRIASSTWKLKKCWGCDSLIMTKSNRSKQRRQRWIEVCIVFSTPLETPKNLQTIGNKQKPTTNTTHQRNLWEMVGYWLCLVQTRVDHIFIRVGESWSHTLQQRRSLLQAHTAWHSYWWRRNRKKGVGSEELKWSVARGENTIQWNRRWGRDVEIKMELVGQGYIDWMPSPPFPTPIPNFIYWEGGSYLVGWDKVALHATMPLINASAYCRTPCNTVAH